jgi:hypothetical protein
MKNRRKLSMRTETCEQIVIRSKSRTLRSGAATENPTGSKGVGKYRMEIYRIGIDSKEKVFECELSDATEPVKNDLPDRST